jgi:hypothetical protein
MGMLSHAVIARDDGSVFVHLHPSGTVSMAAQQVFAQSLSGPPAGGGQGGPTGGAGMETMPGMDQPAAAATGTAILSFPYEFPRPGAYRLWVQVKSGGRILTGVFAAAVAKQSS